MGMQANSIICLSFKTPNAPLSSTSEADLKIVYYNIRQFLLMASCHWNDEPIDANEKQQS
jgi:hypothetical protein